MTKKEMIVKISGGKHRGRMGIIEELLQLHYQSVRVNGEVAQISNEWLEIA